MTEDPPLIVGVGASAGGIEALSALLAHIPEDQNLAVAIVTHLPAEHESQLHEVLSHKTGRTVVTAQDGARLRAGSVHVMPGGRTMTIEDGRLKLHDLDKTRRERRPIDVFFSALAEDQGENAVGIVLSGGDGDGTLGVKLIKEKDGVTFAQGSDGSEPANPEMPQSAIASGFVDFALPADEIGPKLVDLLNGRIRLDALTIPTGNGGGEAGAQDVQTAISGILRDRTGHDFTGYKDKTFFRRVARRMKVRGIEELEDYRDLLERDRVEVDALFGDLLIRVTNFFRDAKAFEALRAHVVPTLLEERDVDNPVRIWVPACTTGEEVYSLAILLREHADGMNRPLRAQIFATDIDEASLTVARQGRYPEPLLANVSDARRERFFHHDGASYVVNKEIRDLCVFSPHNLISDPPFSRMDMISCRNLLIYFGPDLQHQVIPTFHYALKPGGYLFLGTSESIGRFEHLFGTVDKHNRIFQALEHVNRQWSPPPFLTRDTTPTNEPVEHARDAAFTGIQLRHRVERQVLDRHTPAHVVVRPDGDVAYFSGGTAGVIDVPRGQPSRQLLDMVRRELRPDLRTLLHDSARQHTVETRRVRIPRDGEADQWIRLRVEPLDGANGYEPLFLVVFGQAETPPAPAPQDAARDAQDQAVEQELREMRERLQSTVEEYETALEELKSSNEELVSVNEEAQSTNEELEASKEEMESLNEELNTINAELNDKIGELDSANSDLRNLFDAIRIATVFLDNDLVIRNFTPAAAELFNLRAVDVGRPLTDFASVQRYPGLEDQIRGVFDSGEMHEHRLSRDDNGTHYLVRVNPYLTEDANIRGAVVTFVDVTRLAEAEEQQKVMVRELNHRVKNMLTVAHSVVRSTLAQDGRVEDVREVLLDRLHSMGRTYGLLSDSAWERVGMREIVELEQQAVGDGRFDITGPDVMLSPSQAMALSMIVHELATNAVKYGALSNGDGRVCVNWEQQDGDVALTWQERGAPEIAEIDRSGFGLTLIKTQGELQLGGHVETSFDADGLTMSLSFPLTEPGPDA